MTHEKQMEKEPEKDTEIAAQYLRDNLARPVVLVGMMGVGKTHLGRKLAARLGLEFRDSDKLVEEKAGRSVAQIFEEFGEEKFRHAERNSILEILSDGAIILATGGGAVMNDETRKAIKSKSISVWLKAPVSDILKRVENTNDRPLLKNGNPEETLTRLLKQREPLYTEADIHVESGTGQQDKTLETLINSLYEHLKTARV